MEQQINFKIFRDEKTEKYGFLNTKTDGVLIEPIYDSVETLNYSATLYSAIQEFEFCRLKINNEWCIFDRLGYGVVPPDTEHLNDFCFDLAQVRLNDKYGYIDTRGKEIIPLKYDWIDYFEKGFAKMLLNEKYGYIDIYGEEIIPPKYDFVESFDTEIAVVRLNGKYGLVNNKGKKITPVKYDKVEYLNGWAVVKLNNKYGGVNEKGEEIIPLQYDCVLRLEHGLAVIDSNFKYGYINKYGEKINHAQYDGISRFVDDFACVISDDKYGCIDKTGKEVIPPEYDRIWILEHHDTFGENIALVASDEECFFVNKDGKKDPVFQVLQFILVNKWIVADAMVVIKLNGKKGLLALLPTMAGLWTPLIYDSIACEDASDDVAVKLDGKWGLLRDCNHNIEPKYDYIWPFKEDLAVIEMNDKYGFINTKGEEVIPVKYDYAEDFIDGKAEVTLGDETFYIDKQGKRI